MEKDLDYAFVRDDDIGPMRVAFVRLVPANTQFPADTIIATEAHVDLDQEGNIIGVTLFMPTGPYNTAPMDPTCSDVCQEHHDDHRDTTDQSR